MGGSLINFYPFSLDVASPGYELRDKKEIGAQGPFSSTPATIVAPGQFAIAEYEDNIAYVNLNDTVTRQTLAVDWALRRGSAQVFMQDIRFMAIGEVSGTRPGPLGPPLSSWSARDRAGKRAAKQEERATVASGAQGAFAPNAPGAAGACGRAILTDATSPDDAA